MIETADEADHSAVVRCKLVRALPMRLRHLTFDEKFIARSPNGAIENSRKSWNNRLQVNRRSIRR
jgi:hypothetical protein